MPTLVYPNYVKKELEFPGEMSQSATGMKVRRGQEWLTFHKFGTNIDDDFGPATKKCVENFQTAKNLPSTGKVNSDTWDKLVEPLKNALADITPAASDTLASLTLKYAHQHRKIHPIELGKQNCGAWVRLYMKGNDGEEWLWCAGFVTFVLKQACDTLGKPMPIAGSFSCDELAAQAKQAGLFVSGTSIASGATPWNSLGKLQIFLVRKSASDWTHTGFCFGGSDQTFSTIEGNADFGGSRNGFEVTKLTRSLASKDFIKLL